MSDQGIDIEPEAPETQSTSPDTGDSEDAAQSGGDLGEHQAAAADDDAWYSESSGEVVDSEGNAFVDPKTGRSFSSIDAYNKWKGAQFKPAQPDNQNQQAQAPQKPMQKAFESFFSGPDGKVSMQQLFSMAKAGAEFNYNNELVPKIQAAQPGGQQSQPEQSPLEKLMAERKGREEQSLNPIVKIRDALVQNGLDPNVANNLLDPIYREQQDAITKWFDAEQPKAYKAMVSSEVTPIKSAAEEKELIAKSEANVSRLASAYYPQQGKDALFALLNGYTDDKGQFQRGPAAGIMDLLIDASSNGKNYGSVEERNKAYQQYFLRATADPAKAALLVDLAHNYWLGRQAQQIYETGKTKAAQQQRNVQQVIKTKPQSFNNGVDIDEDMPGTLRMALQAAHQH